MCASSHCKKTTITVMKLLAGAADSRNSSALADATEIHMLIVPALLLFGFSQKQVPVLQTVLLKATNGVLLYLPMLRFISCLFTSHVQ